MSAAMLRNLHSRFSAFMLAQARGFGHILLRGRPVWGLGFCLVALCGASNPARADAFVSVWSGATNDKAHMRLVAGTPHGLRSYLAAAQIKLAGRAITYWRVPGDAGVPPTFSFAGSDNLASAQVAYPAPQRIDEQGLQAFGYRAGVTFPIVIKARDPAKPVHLRLRLDYAVCDNICLPARDAAALILPQSGVSGADDIIAQAEAQVPVPLTKDEMAKDIAIRNDPDAAPARWILTWKGTSPASDLFAEAPDGWDIATHRLADGRFALIAAQIPLKSVPSRVPVQLTLTGPQKSYVFTLDLDVPAQASPSGAK
jgi:DsbC/DsbD-like thiol-disulfide interchange protein